MKGFLISVKPYSNGDRNLFNTLFYGKVRYVKEKKEAYYTPGMLDTIPYWKPTVGKVFVNSLENMNIDLLEKFAEVIIIECERKIHPKGLRTGEERWKSIIIEHGKTFRRAKRTRKILQVNNN